MGVRDDLERQADPINRFHAKVERSTGRTGLEWTFIRSGGMAINTLGLAPQIRNGGVARPTAPRLDPWSARRTSPRWRCVP
jgi:uncharacterized protein YbjT (DUF2867 family)